MKKFLALFMAIALLAVAGSAFAVDGDDIAGHFVPPSDGTGGAEVVVKVEGAEVTTIALSAIDVQGMTADNAKKAIEDQIAADLESQGFSSAQIAKVLADIQSALENWLNDVFGTFIRSVSEGVSAAADVKIQDNSNLVVTESTKTVAEQADEASAYLQMANYKLAAVTVLPSMTTKEAGIYSFMLPEFDSKMYGLSVEAFSNVGENGVEKGRTVLLNSNGKEITAIPGLANDGSVAGFVTFAMYMEADKTYKPVIAVSTTEAQAKGLGSTKEVTVTTRVEAAETATFSTYVPYSLTKDTEYKTVPASAVSKTGWTYTAGEKDKLEGTADYSMLPIASFPAITAPSESSWYIVAVSFDNDGNTADDLYTNTADFYPDNVLQASATARYFKEGSDGKLQELTASDILGAGEAFAGYIAFQLSPAKGAQKPVVTVNVKKSDSPTEFTVNASKTSATVALNKTDTVTLTARNALGNVTYGTPSASWVTLVKNGNNATVTIAPTDSALVASSPNTVTITATDGGRTEDNTFTVTLRITVTSSATPTTPGKSGGGCSAGFSALALAVLGLFIAKHRK